MIEPEMAFADLNDNMRVAEGMLKYIIRYVLENAPAEMNFFNQFVDKNLLERLKRVLNSEFGHVTYTEAVKILEKNNDNFDYKVFWGCDLQTEHERYLTEEVFKRPVFVTDYPKEIKAFYMKQNDDGRTVAAMDCLVPGIGEIIGGSERENDYQKLLTRMNELGLKEDDYKFYLDLRKYGSTRHAGFGLGFERCVMYLTGMANNPRRDSLPADRQQLRTLIVRCPRTSSRGLPVPAAVCYNFMPAPFPKGNGSGREVYDEIYPHSRYPLGHEPGQRQALEQRTGTGHQGHIYPALSKRQKTGMQTVFSYPGICFTASPWSGI